MKFFANTGGQLGRPKRGKDQSIFSILLVEGWRAFTVILYLVDHTGVEAICYCELESTSLWGHTVISVVIHATIVTIVNLYPPVWGHTQLYQWYYCNYCKYCEFVSVSLGGHTVISVVIHATNVAIVTIVNLYPPVWGTHTVISVTLATIVTIVTILNLNPPAWGDNQLYQWYMQLL